MKSRIVQARELAGLSQKELAAEMGISPSTLNGYERGKHDPKSDGLTSISKICGVTVDFLLNLSDTPNKTGPAIPTPPKQNTAASEPDTAANIAKRYGGLDYHGKMAVCAVMTAEERRLDDSAVYQFEAVAKGGQQNGARAIDVEDVARCAEIAAKISAESSDDM